MREGHFGWRALPHPLDFVSLIYFAVFFVVALLPVASSAGCYLASRLSNKKIRPMERVSWCLTPGVKVERV